MYSLQKTKPSHTFQKIRPTRQESPFKKGFFDSLFGMLRSPGEKSTITSLQNVAMLIVKKRSKSLQEYKSVNAGKAQTRLLFVV